MTADTPPPTKEAPETRTAPLLSLPLLLLVQAVLCLIGLCLIFVPYDNRVFLRVHSVGLAYTSFFIPILVNTVLLISHLRKEPQSKLSWYIYSGIFGFLLLVSGIIICRDWYVLIRAIHIHYPKMFMDMMIASGVFAIFSSFISFGNLYLIYKCMK